MEKTMGRARAAAHEPSSWADTRRAGVFYLLAYAISWLSWVLMIAFPQLDGRPRVLWRVGMFGPFLAAIAMALIYGGRAGLWAWLKAAFRWRIGVLWYLAGGLILPLGIALLHLVLYLLSGGHMELASDPPWYFVAVLFPINVLIAAPIGSGMGEEPAWQGFAVPRLARRFHPLLVCTIHGVLWAAWHLPAFLTSWLGKESLGWFFAYVIPLSMITFWLTRKAKGSVIPAVLLHSSTNLYSSYYLSDMIFANTLAANFTEIKTVLYWAVALVLIVATRGRLGCARTEEKTTMPSETREPSVCPDPTETADQGEGQRISRVENGLVRIGANGQPQWGDACALAERMPHYQVPGVSVAVIDDYKLDWVKGYGVHVVGEDEAVTAQTLFHAGSVAKSLSAAATLTLVEQGLLHLDENVNDTLVSWQVPENEFTTAEKATLRRLLSHSAGLKDGLTDRSPADPMPAYVTFGDEMPAVTLQQLLEGMPEDDTAPTRVVSVPGTGYRYANADYAILELLVEDRLGQPFDDLMQASVLDRLGMAHSSYYQPLPAELRACSASEHTLDGKPVQGGRANFPFHAAGSLWTTPGDLALFMIDLMQAYQGETGHILSPHMAQQMMSPQIEILNNPLSDAYGLGVELQNTGQGPKVWHTGATWGSFSVMWFYPQLGKGAVVMTNSASGSLLGFEILLSIASAYGWPTD
jgi:CubicO group peptidase (beta-lactamase class C family)/membrane protease YdiL (CAAX protease family)